MAQLLDGARVEVQGSGANRYTLEHKGDVYSCTCPAWRNQRIRIELRTCKHLRAYLGNESESARAGAAALSVTAAAGQIRARRVSRFIEDPELRDHRLAQLQKAVERYPVLDDRMQTVYGMRMPKHLAYAMGFWMGLTEVEQKEASLYLGKGPVGVGAWFVDGVIERRLKPGLDERLAFRYRRDPPEMVTIFTRTSDAGHWGLWYDDPKEFPTTIAFAAGEPARASESANESVNEKERDSAETKRCEATLLKTFREDVVSEGDPYDPAEWPQRNAIMNWLDYVLDQEIEAYEDQRSYWPGARPNDLLGGMASIDPAWVIPDELIGPTRRRERYDAYKRRDPIVKEWIALANKELAEGSAGRALFLGRELHWMDADEWRAECTALLMDAYESLERHALAEIVNVHHHAFATTPLARVDVYEAPVQSPFAVAIEAGDVDALQKEIASGVIPPAAEIAQALRTVDLRVLQMLLDLDHPEIDALAATAAASHVDDALAPHARIAPLVDDDDPRLRETAAQHRAAAIEIFKRRGAKGRAFSSALEPASTAPVRAAAIMYADLEWRSPRGRSVLHLAAAAPNPTAVGRLLERGADPRVKDQDGKMAYDAARLARERHPTEASAIFEILTARGGGPPAIENKEEVAASETWAVGMTVTHSTFGEGVIESIAGTADKTKLTVKFAAATKTVVAKFVTRK